jgi:hypothetical protein
MGDEEGRWDGEEVSDRSQFHSFPDFLYVYTFTPASWHILKMGAEDSSETLINVFRTTQYLIQEDIH